MTNKALVIDLEEFSKLIQGNNTMQQDKRISRKEAATMLGICPRTIVRKYQKTNILQNLNPGGKTLFLLSDILEIMTSRPGEKIEKE